MNNLSMLRKVSLAHTLIEHICAPLPSSAGCVYEVARSGVLAAVAASHCHNTRQGNYNYNHSPPLHFPPTPDMWAMCDEGHHGE